MTIDRDRNLRLPMATFLEEAIIHVMVPDNPLFDLAAVLDADTQAQVGLGKSIEEYVIQREKLYIDETTNVIIVLKTKYQDAEILKTQLKTLAMVMETCVMENKLRGEQRTSTRTLLMSTTVDNVHDPLIIVGQESSNSNGGIEQYVSMVWILNVHLNHQSLRHFAQKLDAAICFTATLTQQSTGAIREHNAQDEYLPSGVPGSINLLAAYRNNPYFRKNPPSLLSSRLVKFSPSDAKNEELQGQSRTVSSHLFQLGLAVTYTVKFYPTGVSPKQTEVFISLIIDVSTCIKNHVVFEVLALSVTRGRAEALGPSSLSLPLLCSPGDSASFIYRLLPNHPQGQSIVELSNHVLRFNVSASLHRNSATHRSLRSTWSTSVNLFPPQGSSTVSPHLPVVAEPSIQPIVSSSLDQLITFTFTSAPTVAIGSVLHWSVLLANRSTKRTLRLALIPITEYTSLDTHSTSRVTTGRRVVPPGLPRTIPPLSYLAPMGPLPNHERVLTTTTDTTSIAAKLTALTPSTYLGPLPPGTSATAEIPFLVLEPGIGGVKLVRIVDLDAEGERRVGETKDEELRWVDLESEWLPDVVAVEGNEGFGVSIENMETQRNDDGDRETAEAGAKVLPEGAEAAAPYEDNIH